MRFPPEILASLETAGVSERWQAVQAQLHPMLAALAEALAAEALAALPRSWPLYEISYKSQRALNHGNGRRAPIEDYWLALDRAPRGAGVLITVSAAERTISVGLQIWGSRKRELATVWEQGHAIWQPLIAAIGAEGEARFRGHDEGDGLWIERYLQRRSANYLWCGWSVPWHDQPEDLSDWLRARALALLPLNEAIMEAAEARQPAYERLREERAPYRLEQPFPPIEQVSAVIRERGLVIDERDLRSYHLAIQNRPLVILAGISGTGKTRLTRLYADAVHQIAPGRDNPFYLAVAVQPDWHSARDLLGYFNAISGRYHPTPFLRFLLRAATDPQAPYFLCFDEMNLARPEYYLAPLLSASETLERRLDLGLPADEALAVDGSAISASVRLPLNLHLTGTVNLDESSFALSDKVLDRADLIELTRVDLNRFAADYAQPIDPWVWQVITAAHAILSEAGRPFGYRTLSAILGFVERSSGTLSLGEALDRQLLQVVLPKLRGEATPRLQRAIADLLALCQQAALAQSAERLERLRERLARDGFADLT